MASRNGGGDDDMMKQAQHIWSMLDELADSDPEAYKKFIEKNITEGKERNSPAQPSICIQTKMLNGKPCDLFINICSWNRVPRPKTDHDPIPVIAGEMKEVFEETKMYKVVPIAFNEEVLKECFEAEDTTRMLLNLSLDYVTNHFNVNLDRKFTKLKDTKFKGDSDPFTLATCFLKNTKSNQEMKDNFSMGCIGNLTNDKIRISTDEGKKNCEKLIEEISSTDSKLPEPEYLLDVVNDDKRGRCIDIRISLPDVKSVQQCELDISADDVCLLVEDLYKLQLVLPESVLEDDTTAKFNKKSTTLNIKIPTKIQDDS